MACALCNMDFRSRIGKPGISFHRFPTDKLLEEEWVQVIRRQRGDPNWTVKISSKVCSRHFKLEDLFVANGKVYLNKGAVPATKTESKRTYNGKLKNSRSYDGVDSLLRSLEVKGQVGCAQKHSLTFPVTRTMQAPLKVQYPSEFVVKKPKRTYSKCKSERQQASYIKSANGHVAMPITYSPIATGSRSFDLVIPKYRTPPALAKDSTIGDISTNSLLQGPPKKLVCKEKKVGAKKIKEVRMECIIKEEPEENWEDVATWPLMSPEDIKREEDKEDVATWLLMSQEGIKRDGDQEDVATCPPMSPEDIKREGDQEDVATCPPMSPEDIKREEDKEDVATCPPMSPEDIKREEDKEDVATCPPMSPEGIKRKEDKEDVATCPPMSPEGIKHEEAKEDVATCPRMSPEGINREGPRMRQEGIVFSVPGEAERLDSQGILIGHNEIRAAQEDCMKRTTSIADKVIETEIRNTWGREVVKIVNHCVDSLVNDVVEKWERWRGQGTDRNVFVYKCYVCCRGWWRLDPFREHLKWHERNMDLEVLKLRLEGVMQECNIVARSISAKEEGGDVDVEGYCWRCLRSYEEHKEMFEKGKPCDGCSAKFYTCTALLKHEGGCLDYVILSYHHCKLCRTVWSTKDRYTQHRVEMHSVRSDLPISDGLPGFKCCKLCGMPYWVFDYHDCPKRNIGFFQKCMYCCRRFQNVAFRKLHYHSTKPNVKCRACPKMLKRQCMELEHMLKHSKTYVQVYKCRCCTESVLFRKEELLKRHLLAKHNSKYSSLTQIKTAAIPLFVPKTLLSSPNGRWGGNNKAMAVEDDRPTIDYNVDIKLTNVQINSKDLLIHNNEDFGTLKTGIGPTIDYEENPAEPQIDYIMKEEQIYSIKKEEQIDNMNTEEEYGEYSKSYDQEQVTMEMEYKEEVSSNVFSEALLHEELIIKEEQEDEDFDGDSGDDENIVGV